MAHPRRKDPPVNIGPLEIAIVLILALLVLGPKRLPQAGRSLGQAMRELRKATTAARSDLGLDDVAADVRDLKSSLSIDLKDADQPTPPKPEDDAVAAAIEVPPAVGAADSATDEPEAADAVAADDAPSETPEEAAVAGEAPDTAEEPQAPRAPEAPPEPGAPAAAPAPGDA